MPPHTRTAQELRILEDFAKYKRGVEETMEQVAWIAQSQKQDGAGQNKYNVPVPARNDPKQGGARQNQIVPAQNDPKQGGARQNQLVPAQNDPKQGGARQNQLMPHRVLVPAQDALGNSLNLYFQELHLHGDTNHHGASNEETEEYFSFRFSKFLKSCLVAAAVCTAGVCAVYSYVVPTKDLYESLYKIPGIKYPMHLARFALDTSDASEALQDCIRSKTLNKSDLAGLTRCWEYVYDDLGKNARLLVFEGNPSYIHEIITRPQFFNLLGGVPRRNSVKLTPWIPNLTHKEICALIDENRNGAIELGEVDAAKHKNFLVVAGLEDQKYVAALRRILTDNPDTHYSQCIAWLETLPQSNPQLPETTLLERLASDVATYVCGIAPYVVIAVLSSRGTGGGRGGGAAFMRHAGTAAMQHAITGGGMKRPWKPHINILADPAQLSAFTGDGNPLGNTP